MSLPLRLALLAALALPAQATEPEPSLIYGAELMSARERDQYRRELQRHPDAASRAEFHQRHRERIHKRAQRRGVELDSNQGVIRRRQRGEGS